MRATPSETPWSGSWTAIAGQGVALVGDRSEVRFWANDATAVEPTLEPDGHSVRYADVAPGTDLVYRVSGSGVEETLVLKSAAAARATGKGVESDAFVFEVETSVDGVADVTELEIGLDADFVEGFPAGDFPVVIDPSIQFTRSQTWTHKYERRTTDGSYCYEILDNGNIRFGNKGGAVQVLRLSTEQRLGQPELSSASSTTTTAATASPPSCFPGGTTWPY